MHKAMRPNELRIGNYVSQREEIYRLDENSLIDILEYWKQFKEVLFQPIPLTEEWLLKFGFRNECGYDCAVCYTFDFNTGHTINFLNKELYCYLDSKRLDNIKYVHQLQNLYFALTGQELEIK